MSTAKTIGEPVWIELSQTDFIAAIKRLKPKRVTRAYLRRELQIGLIDREAEFTLQEIQTRCAAQGAWPGIVCLPYRALYAYLKIKPPMDPVRMEYRDGRLRLDSARLSAVWIDLPETVSAMTLDAHFMTQEDTQRWHCPICRRKQVRRLDGLPSKARLNDEERLLTGIRDTTDASHACGHCGYAWKEVDVNRLS